MINLDKLSGDEIELYRRKVEYQIKAERHETLHIIYTFMCFLSDTGNQGCLLTTVLDTNAAMNMRRRAIYAKT